MQKPNTRRDFLQTSAALSTVGLGFWSTSMVSGQDNAGPDAPAQEESKSPNERINWGAIATGDRWGSMGSNDKLRGVGGNAMEFGDFLAVCDVDSQRKERAKRLTGGKADMYVDYRYLLDRDDIDAVTIVSPDHWHTIMALDALAAGKDVYCEKPLTLTIEEGRLICNAVEKTGRVFQVGTQQRTEFGRRFVKAVAIAHSGRLGKIKRVTCAIGSSPTSGELPAIDPPGHLNWNQWLGPAPMTALRQLNGENGKTKWTRCHYEFRWWYEYSGGKMTDWGAHHVDIAQWAMGLDNTSPVKIEPLEVEFPVEFEDGYPTRDDKYNTPTKFKVRCTYDDGSELVIRESAEDLGFGNGILIEGEKAKIFVNRGKLTGGPVEELETNPLPEEIFTKLSKGQKPKSHMGNFVDCIKTREQPISDVFTHHRTMSTCHLANIALRLGRELKFNPETEQIEGDDKANEFVSRTPREGFEYPKVV